MNVLYQRTARVLHSRLVFGLLLSTGICSLSSVSAQQQQQSNASRGTPATVDAPARATISVNANTSTSQRDTAAATTTQPVNAKNDLEIIVNLTARELRFEVVPNPNVEFTGQPARDTAWEAVRENLPKPVQPGVTYRDIGIRLVIRSRFADIERIVAEALGEVPPGDDAVNTDAAPVPTTPSPSVPTPPNNNAPPGTRPR